MSEFVLREEDFHLGLMERPSTPEPGSCFILYRRGGGEENSFLIQNGMRLQSAEIRRGKYDRKAAISIEEKRFRYSQKVSMKYHDFFFDVSVEMGYRVSDPRAYYFGKQLENEEELRQLLRKILKKCDEEWEIKQGPKMEIYIEEQLEAKLFQYKGITFQIAEIKAKPDENAARIIQSDNNKVVGQHISENETDMEISQYAQKVRALKGKEPLEMLQMEKFAKILNTFGALGPIVSEYLDGQKDGEALYNYMMNNKLNELNLMNQAMEKDLLSQEDAFLKVKELLSDSRLAETDKGLLEKKEENAEEPIEKREISDGEYI